jgi:hypothetical protein
MKWNLIACIAVAPLLAFASPVVAALSPEGCSVLQQSVEASPNLQGALNNSGCPGISSIVISSGANPTVAASEPLTLLTVGLGLLAAGRLLRRR